MIVAAHQPDLLPYSGFFYKMAKADVFDVKIFDQYVNRGYQRRVMMRDKWATIPILTSSSHAPIDTLRMDPDRAPAVLVEIIGKRYTRARHWDKYGPMICDYILTCRTEKLWQFNLDLIVLVRDILGITTPLSIGIKPHGKGSVGVISALVPYGSPTYLSGMGAKAYMSESTEFEEAGIPVIWSKHRAITGDSILTVLMDHDDPLGVVMTEHETEHHETEQDEGDT